MILATDSAVRWRDNATDLDFDATYDSVKATMVVKFNVGHSKALRHTLHEMGNAVINEHDAIDEIKFSRPNKHHFLSDLSFCGWDNPNVVFYAADGPYGLIEATSARNDAPTSDAAWTAWPASADGLTR